MRGGTLRWVRGSTGRSWDRDVRVSRFLGRAGDELDFVTFEVCTEGFWGRVLRVHTFPPWVRAARKRSRSGGGRRNSIESQSLRMLRLSGFSWKKRSNL